MITQPTLTCRGSSLLRVNHPASMLLPFLCAWQAVITPVNATAQRPTVDLSMVKVDPSVGARIVPFGDAGVIVVEAALDSVIIVWANGTVSRRGLGIGATGAVVLSAGMQDNFLWIWNEADRSIYFHGLEGRVRERRLLRAPSSSRDVLLIPRVLLADTSVIWEELSTSSSFHDVVSLGRVLLRTSLSVARSDTVAMLASRNGMLRIETAAGGVLLAQQPWAAADLFATSPTGSHWYIIRQRQPTAPSPDSVHILSFQRNGLKREFWMKFVPVALQESEVTNYVNAAVFGAFVGAFADSVQAVRAVRSALFVPGFRPAFDRALVADDGSLLLRKHESSNWLRLLGA